MSPPLPPPPDHDDSYPPPLPVMDPDEQYGAGFSQRLSRRTSAPPSKADWVPAEYLEKGITRHCTSNRVVPYILKASQTGSEVLDILKTSCGVGIKLETV